MKLSEYISEERGRGAAIAAFIGVDPQLVYQWAAESRPVPVPRCNPIEKATKGMVTRKDLRPNDWMDLWPELAKPARRAKKNKQ